jgi:hypothetical protein
MRRGAPKEAGKTHQGPKYWPLRYYLSIYLRRSMSHPSLMKYCLLEARAIHKLRVQ